MIVSVFVKMADDSKRIIPGDWKSKLRYLRGFLLKESTATFHLENIKDVQEAICFLKELECNFKD